MLFYTTERCTSGTSPTVPGPVAFVRERDAASNPPAEPRHTAFVKAGDATGNPSAEPRCAAVVWVEMRRRYSSRQASLHGLCQRLATGEPPAEPYRVAVVIWGSCASSTPPA